jgi:Na+:H+ antiporter, NhaA family
LTTDSSPKKGVINTLQEFSIPLILGVIAALVFANIDYDAYHHVVDWPVFGDGASLFGHKITAHFLINDIFMVFFFGIAAKEITESVLPGGPLNPMKKAINPLLGTIGGVVGPIGVFLILAYLVYAPDAGAGFDAIGRAMTPGGGSFEATDLAAVFRGWGVPTATDIALAWLVARLVFGKGHPAVNFLLLLAVADDAIGLGIIAVFYPNPEHPVAIQWVALTILGMAVAYGMRRAKVKSWVPYIMIAGTLSWLGLILASLHPALALVPIVPFLPGPKHDDGLFVEVEHADDDSAADDSHAHGGHSPLEQFEHQLKFFVDMGLFFFAFANAGVALGSINAVTWIVLASLLVGKTIGIVFFSVGGAMIGFPLPSGMKAKHVVVSGVVAALGLTVVLFVSGEAYPGDSPFQGPAKMGAVLSAGAAFVALALGKFLKVKDGDT